jgi:hypothetical protein
MEGRDRTEAEDRSMQKSNPTLMLCGVALIAALTTGAEPALAEKGKGFAYTPPLRGAPSSAVRVGGGTRGNEQRTFALSVLTPDHVGLTMREQPSLYWFISEPLKTPAELTLIEAEGFDTLLQIRLDPPVEAGVHELRLSEHGVRLKPDVTYQWFVAMVVNENFRSSDVVAAGEIRRVAAAPGVAGGGDAIASADAVAAAAQAGLWYDTIDGISRMIAAQPGDAELREQRASLLEQVGLAQVAAFERSAKP